MKKSLFAIAGLALLLGIPFEASAASNPDSYQAEGVYHGTNRYGLTGLYYTVSPYSVGTGLSANGYAEVTSTTTGTTTVTPFSVTLGLGQNIEISGASRLYSGGGINATGDSEFYAKYSFRSLGEVAPAMALVLGVTLPTASDPAASDVNNLGAKIMFVAGGEAQVSDNVVMGTYFNMTANFIDPGQATQNNYISSNLGFMMPISDNNKLQGFIDSRFVSGKTTPTISEADGVYYMIGLRYTGRFLKITGGIEEGGAVAKVIAGVTLEI